MENIKFEITEQDIKDYLKAHKKDELIKYREAMFVKYMRESKKITRESLEIMMSKYNSFCCSLSEYELRSYVTEEKKSLYDFSTYLRLQNLDISGICHILIPTLGFYGDYQNEYHLANPLSLGLNTLSMKLIGTIPEIAKQEFGLALADYEVAGKISCDSNVMHKPVINIHINKEHCRRELEKYSYIYGDIPVKTIRKYIRERM